jgi:drug/metabolite transporter (DMT)-like permease
VIWCGTLLLLPFLPAALISLRSASSGAVAALLFLGLGPAALAYAVWAYALAHYPVGRATSFLYLAPPITLLMGYFLLDEHILMMTVFGGCLALAGVVLVNTLGRPRPGGLSQKNVKHA